MDQLFRILQPKPSLVDILKTHFSTYKAFPFSCTLTDTENQACWELVFIDDAGNISLSSAMDETGTFKSCKGTIYQTDDHHIKMNGRFMGSQYFDMLVEMEARVQNTKQYHVPVCTVYSMNEHSERKVLGKYTLKKKASA